MPNETKSCIVELKFIANSINVTNLYMAGDEISEKHKSKWDTYKSTIRNFSNNNLDVSELEIEGVKNLIYLANGTETIFDIIDEFGNISYDWFKFMVKYIPIILDKNTIYTLLVNESVYGTSKDWYNLFIHTSKKIDNKIKSCLLGEVDHETLSITLMASGSSKYAQSVEPPKIERRRSIFSEVIPERRQSDTHFGRNYLGRSLEKAYKKRPTEPSLPKNKFSSYESDDESSVDSSYQNEDECNETMCSLKLYDKKDYRTWLIKNHPDKNGDVQVFQMYRPILEKCSKSRKFCKK